MLDISKYPPELRQTFFDHVAMIKEDTTSSPETEYRVYESTSSMHAYHDYVGPVQQYFVITTKREFFAKTGNIEKWDTHVEGWLNISKKDSNRVFSYFAGRTHMMRMLWVYLTPEKDEISIATPYLTCENGWYPLAIMPHHRCLYTQEEINRSAQLYRGLVLDISRLGRFLNSFQTEIANCINSTGYFIHDLSPNNIIMKEDYTDFAIIDLLSLERHNISEPPRYSMSNLVYGRASGRWHPTPLWDDIIDEETGERFFPKEQEACVRDNVNEIFGSHDRKDHEIWFPGTPHCWVDDGDMNEDNSA